MVNSGNDPRIDAFWDAADGETIGKIMKIAGVKQQEVADDAKVHRVSVSNMVTERCNTGRTLKRSALLVCERRMRDDPEKRRRAIELINSRIEKKPLWLDPDSKMPFSAVLCAREVSPEKVDLLDLEAMLSVCTLVLDPKFTGTVFYEQVMALLIAALRKTGKKAVLSVKRWYEIRERYGTKKQMIEDEQILEEVDKLNKEGLLEIFCSDGQDEKNWRETFYLLKEDHPETAFVFLTGDTDNAAAALRSNRKRPDKTTDWKGKPVRVLGYDGWHNRVPDLSDPDFLKHWFSEWTPERVEEIEAKYDSQTETYIETERDKEQW